MLTMVQQQVRSMCCSMQHKNNIQPKITTEPVSNLRPALQYAWCLQYGYHNFQHKVSLYPIYNVKIMVIQ